MLEEIKVLQVCSRLLNAMIKKVVQIVVKAPATMNGSGG
jgi:hypothetical protein